MSTQQFLLSAWSWNPAVLIVAALGLVAYLFGFGVNRRLGWFLAALAIFLLTLLSPISALAAGYLFSAHMLQHILLLLIVPGLIFVSLPRSFSLAWRPRLVAHPLTGWIAGVGAMWFWHYPALCNAAVNSSPVYAVQTASLVILGTLFWSQVCVPREEERLSPPGAVLYLFSACVTCSALGIILTFSPVSVCPIYAMTAADSWAMSNTIRSGWAMTPERDQEIGGLLMWVPMCFIYLGAIFAQIARWFGEPRLIRPTT